jgi:KDO2-lipid IV(A) lauroyltransferase
MWFFYGLSRLPFFVLYLISDFLAFLASTVFKYRKKVILKNLRKSFPEKTEQELEVITKGFYKNLSDIVVETIKGLTISQKELDRRVKIVNEDVLVKYLQGNTTNIALASHQGNWEWLLLSCSSRLPVNVQAAYKPLRNQFFEKLMYGIRSRFGTEPIPSKQLVRRMVQLRGQTSLFALVADQSPDPQQATVVEFLNQKTIFLNGPQKLYDLSKGIVYYAEMVRVKRGYYTIQAHFLAELPYQGSQTIIQDYAKAVEKSIARNPESWLWSHKRWKFKVE